MTNREPCPVCHKDSAIVTIAGDRQYGRCLLCRATWVFSAPPKFYPTPVSDLLLWKKKTRIPIAE